MESPDAAAHLTWLNVALAFVFILFNVIVALVFGLDTDYPVSLFTAAVRCVTQLWLLTVVLKYVFSGGPWEVALLAIVLNLLGTFETVVNKSKRRFSHMFPSVLLAMATSTLPVSIIGARFAMSHDPFWKPETYIPVLGMLCGSTISGIVVASTSVLREVEENRDKIETYLAFGASRFEAAKPIATEALRLALTPTINQMSVIGLISIPGMMTGALLGGSPLDQAAKLQMVIMFMISSSTAAASTVAIVLTLSVVIDPDHRLRNDRIDSRKHVVWRTRDSTVGAVGAQLHRGFSYLFRKARVGFKRDEDSGANANGEESERRPLLG